MKRFGLFVLFFSVAYILIPIYAHASNSENENHHKHKVVICHIPPGNHGNAHTIEIDRHALDAHLGHGDYTGECILPDNDHVSDDGDDADDGNDDSDDDSSDGHSDNHGPNDDPGDEDNSNDDNTAPTWSGPVLATTTVDTPIALTISANDADGDALVITHELPAGSTYTASTSLFTWMPQATGTVIAKFFASDGKATSTHELAVEVSPAPAEDSGDEPDNNDQNDENDNGSGDNAGNNDSGSGGNTGDSNTGNNNSSGGSNNSVGGNSESSSPNNSGGGGSGGTGGVYPGVLTAPQFPPFDSSGQVAGAATSNQAPYFVNFNPPATATANWLYIYDAEAADPDGDRLTFRLVGKPDGMEIVSITGFIYWMPRETQARSEPYSVVVEVSDGRFTARETFQLYVNNPVTNSALLKPDKPIIEGTAAFIPPGIEPSVPNFDISNFTPTAVSKGSASAGGESLAALLFSGLFNNLKSAINWIFKNCRVAWFLLLVLLLIFIWYAMRSRKREARAKRVNEELRRRLSESMRQNQGRSGWTNM